MKVKLLTSDEKEYILDRKLICQSNLIKNMLEDLAISDTAIPLPNINSSVMDIVVKYAEMHKDEPKDEIRARLDDIKPADAELMDMPKKKLFDVILAANYLDFPGLLDLGCKSLANDLMSKSLDEVERDYEVPPELRYTPEEKEAIEQEQRWVCGE